MGGSSSTLPGGASTHVNGGNSNSYAPAHGDIHMPAYKPVKHPDYYKPGKPYRPAPVFRPGFHMYGIAIERIPKGYTRHYYNNVEYYFYGGVFYRKHNISGYIVCRPPVGFVLNPRNTNVLAMPLVIIDIARDPAYRISEAIALADYFEYYMPGYRRPNDNFYSSNVVNQNYEVYYGMDGTYYTIVGGSYRIVNPPIGALTDRLPYDYEEYLINGRIYYKVDNILYTVVAPEGIPYYEIVSLL